jgi:hypothetical protein
MRIVAPLSAACCAAVALSGCGDTVSLDPVAKAADLTTKTSSEHVEFTGSSSAAGRRIEMRGNGDFLNDPQRSSLNLSFTSGTTTGSMQEVTDGWRVYITSSLFAGRLPQGKTWMSLDMKKAGKSAGIDVTTYAGQTPSQTLQLLRRDSTITRVGVEKIDGAATTHYRAVVDPSKVPNAKRIAQLASLHYDPVDVWIGKEGLVRRIHLSSSAAGTSTAMTMDFRSYGEDVNVTVPSDAETFDATSATQQLLKGGTP